MHNGTGVPAALIRARQQRGWTQSQLAEHSGYTQMGISRLERGHREPRLSELHALISVLDADPRDFGLADGDTMHRRTLLTGAAATGAAAAIQALTSGELAATPQPAPANTPAANLSSQIERSLFLPSSAPPASAEQIPYLLRTARSAYRNTDYQQLADTLDTLISTADQLDDPTLSAEVYTAATRALYKLPISHLEWVTSDRALRAASQAGDPLLLAETRRMHSTAHRRLGQHTTSTDMCTHAADQLDTSDPEHLIQAAHTLCTGSYAVAHQGDADRAYEMLAEAKRLTRYADTGSGNSRWDSFATVANVDVYAVSVATVAGDPGAALTAIRSVPLHGLASTERKARFLVDAAAARLAADQPNYALKTLLLATRVAPQETANRPAAAALADRLKTHRRDYTPTLARVGL